MQVHARIVGNNATVLHAGSGGHFQVGFVVVIHVLPRGVYMHITMYVHSFMTINDARLMPLFCIST